MWKVHWNLSKDNMRIEAYCGMEVKASNLSANALDNGHRIIRNKDENEIDDVKEEMNVSKDVN